MEKINELRTKYSLKDFVPFLGTQNYIDRNRNQNEKITPKVFVKGLALYTYSIAITGVLTLGAIKGIESIINKF